MSRIAIFGGTFDPVHWGHLFMAQTALSERSLKRVIWVPSPYPPHKFSSSRLGIEHRVSMVQLAIASHPAFSLFYNKSDSNSPDYAIDTFERLQSLYPDCQWNWIIGLDAFSSLPRWYQRERLIPAVNWLVAPRLASGLLTSPEDSATAQLKQVTQQLAEQGIPIRSEILPMPRVDISSTLIRRLCRQSRTVRYLVPEEVRAYITNHRLYSESD
ncbi:MAG: nicotinate (nicotinamide) nucleotide adenylyltransferase [Cyanobacteria bacterium SW_8_48_13]|nr:MAG: nicotinate (nicotinamide) nucleotide adenylyltransferase [Cyanobacteria bacterium QH_7_48_89]PSP07041.1 MAG: nicotinate (nicotinamide) nucleotide adenylyltransferase [Cyanobacteria bacterium SW_7_48_12]PSP20579.1 MAG: nicotinate (nicotinamide) nucleotide adenylyltransferase [Cyanobacteria bacterium SW_8_48_13]